MSISYNEKYMKYKRKYIDIKRLQSGADQMMPPLNVRSIAILLSNYGQYDGSPEALDGGINAIPIDFRVAQLLQTKVNAIGIMKDDRILQLLQSTTVPTLTTLLLKNADNGSKVVDDDVVNILLRILLENDGTDYLLLFNEGQLKANGLGELKTKPLVYLIDILLNYSKLQKIRLKIQDILRDVRSLFESELKAIEFALNDEGIFYGVLGVDRSFERSRLLLQACIDQYVLDNPQYKPIVWEYIREEPIKYSIPILSRNDEDKWLGTNRSLFVAVSSNNNDSLSSINKAKQSLIKELRPDTAGNVFVNLYIPKTLECVEYEDDTYFFNAWIAQFDSLEDQLDVTFNTHKDLNEFIKYEAEDFIDPNALRIKLVAKPKEEEGGMGLRIKHDTFQHNEYFVFYNPGYDYR